MSDKKLSKTEKLPAVAVKRLDLYAEMPEPLQKVADEITAQLRKGARGIILVRYDIGMLVKKILENEGKYGNNAVEKLEEFFTASSVRTGDLYALRNMVLAYTRDEVEAMAVKEMAGGGHISIGHVLAITQVKSADNRKKLWERVFAEGLSVDALSNEISSSMEKKNRRQGGRKPSPPSSPVAAVQQLFTVTQGINNRFTVWDETLFTAFREVPPEKITTETLERMEQADAALSALEENIQQYHPKFLKNLERARDVVSKKTEKVKAAKAEHKKEAKALDGATKKEKGAKRPQAA